MRELYQEAFQAIGSWVLRNLYRILFWFCFACYLVVLYAFVYRVATGFAFD
ncbi:hypothetical protein H7F20_02640 [Robiginitalea sp. SC105]|nr:DUF6747 family protein [Robiginitalea sp. SC105]MBC2838220.1 hypothetical protein [Robiginitalea sp. SC105]